MSSASQPDAEIVVIDPSQNAAVKPEQHRLLQSIERRAERRADLRPMAMRTRRARSSAALPEAEAPELVRLESNAREALAALTPYAPESVAQLTVIYLRAQKVLNGPDRRYVMALIEDGLHTTATALPDGPVSSERSVHLVAALSQLLRTSCDFVTRREGEVSRHVYARDLGRGVLLSFCVLMVVWISGLLMMKTWLWVQDTSHSWWSVAIPTASMVALRDVLVAVGGGAAGAAVSVLLRLNQQTDLKFESIAEGAARYRIILGWFFAVALLILVKGGIAANLINDPSTVLDEPGVPGSAWVSSWFFWAGVGLLAGFNERWVTNIIARNPKSPAANAADPAPPKETVR
jgi:hypothetical protein